MMYDPNGKLGHMLGVERPFSQVILVFTLNLEQLLSGAPIDTAVGVLQITIHGARGLKGSKIGGGSPDPYVSLSINNRAEMAKTKVTNNT